MTQYPSESMLQSANLRSATIIVVVDLELLGEYTDRPLCESSLVAGSGA